MDEQAVRTHAEAYCDALRAGDIPRAAEEMSRELQSNLGPLVAMLPLPLAEASVESVDMTGKGYRAVLRLVGDTDTLLLETRWKDREGRPTIVEASRVHVDQVEVEAESESAGE